MANYCWNNMLISQIKPEDIECIQTWIKTYDNFSYLKDWVHSLITEENRLDVEADVFKLPYGGRWFDINDIDEDENYMHISGDSAWSPMIGLAQAISKEFQCDVSIDYEESGCDFGGQSVFENGELTQEYQGTYWMYNYDFCGEGIDFLISELACHNSTEEGWIEFLQRISSEGITLSDKEMTELRESMNIETSTI